MRPIRYRRRSVGPIPAVLTVLILHHRVLIIDWTRPLSPLPAAPTVHYGNQLFRTACQSRKSINRSIDQIRFIQCCEWVSVLGLTSHSTHNRSFRRRVFPGNWLHWYWQPKTRKQNTTYTLNTTEKQGEKTALANKTIYTLIWYAS